MRTLALLTAMMIPITVAAALTIKPFTPATLQAASPRPAATSIEEMCRQLKIIALAQLESEDLC